MRHPFFATAAWLSLSIGYEVVLGPLIKNVECSLGASTAELSSRLNKRVRFASPGRQNESEAQESERNTPKGDGASSISIPSYRPDLSNLPRFAADPAAKTFIGSMMSRSVEQETSSQHPEPSAPPLPYPMVSPPGYLPYQFGAPTYGLHPYNASPYAQMPYAPPHWNNPSAGQAGMPEAPSWYNPHNGTMTAQSPLGTPLPPMHTFNLPPDITTQPTMATATAASLGSSPYNRGMPGATALEGGVGAPLGWYPASYPVFGPPVYPPPAGNAFPSPGPQGDSARALMEEVEKQAQSEEKLAPKRKTGSSTAALLTKGFAVFGALAAASKAAKGMSALYKHAVTKGSP